jgi:hypothetical protein
MHTSGKDQSRITPQLEQIMDRAAVEGFELVNSFSWIPAGYLKSIIMLTHNHVPKFTSVTFWSVSIPETI